MPRPTLNQFTGGSPHNDEAEIALLSCVMQVEDDVVSEIIHACSEEHFFCPQRKLIWRAVLSAYATHRKTGMVEIESALSKEEKKAVGGRVAIADIYRAVPGGLGWKQWLATLDDLRYRRELVLLARRMVEAAGDTKTPAEEIKGQLEASLLALDTASESADTSSMREASMLAVEQIEAMYEGRSLGLLTGIEEFDDLLYGFRPSELIIVAARPSVGKTALAMQFIEYWAVQQKKRGLMFSAEMSRDNLAQRQILSMSRTCLQEIVGQTASEATFKRISAASAALSGSALEINDKSSPSIAYMQAVARRAHKKEKLHFVVVDYLQICTGSSRRGKDNRVLEIGEITKGLKGMAKELKIPVLVLAQLSRKPEDRKDGRPILSDLRDSGEVEQDGDVIALMHRKEEGEHGDVVEFNCAKNRNGQTGRFSLYFCKQYTKFERLRHEKE